MNLSDIKGIEVKENCDLTTFTTMRLQSHGTLVEVLETEALKELLPLLNKNGTAYLILGWGANQLLPSEIPGVVIHLKMPHILPDVLHSEYELPASVSLNQLTGLALKFGLKGWEVFTGIPASLGGAIYMNAGTNLGEIGKLIKKVTLATPEGEFRTENITEKSFSYRKNHFVRPGEVIVSAVISHHGTDPNITQKIKDYLEYRKNTQPLATRNCGCVFKNPRPQMPAGKLIDSLGLKDLRIGDLRISPKHGNFMENMGKADWDQFSSLLSIIRHEMDVWYGIEFELEVKIPYH
ncbi:MAG: UDP-N-acetylmuramate dehydrogenase [Bacteriovoracaceae bacterium]